MEEFDWKYSIVHIAVTEGYTNQSTGDYVAPIEVETAISGNLEDITLKELRQYPEGMIEPGSRRIFTAANMAAGDRLEITERGGDTTAWEILMIEESYHMFDEVRTAYLLKRA